MCCLKAEVTRLSGLRLMDLSQSRSVADIICGAHLSLAECALSQLKMSGLYGDVVFIGGVALQEGMVKACGEKFDTTVLVPEFPSHVVAYGAAILGRKRYRKRDGVGIRVTWYSLRADRRHTMELSYL